MILDLGLIYLSRVENILFIVGCLKPPLLGYRKRQTGGWHVRNTFSFWYWYMKTLPVVLLDGEIPKRTVIEKLEIIYQGRYTKY